ncbi:MAG: VCBS repeat-containing protein [Planctomycetes bacterium]|nr:VCBS repeat-containing protein [Planctomycetota bacterium]
MVPAACVAEIVRLDARALYERAVTRDVRLAGDPLALELDEGELFEDDGPAAGYSDRPNEEVLSRETWIRKALLLGTLRVPGNGLWPIEYVATPYFRLAFMRPYDDPFDPPRSPLKGGRGKAKSVPWKCGRGGGSHRPGVDCDPCHREGLSRSPRGKLLLIPNPEARAATLLVGPGGDLRAIINGAPCRLGRSTRVGSYWQAYSLDPRLLKPGRNEFTLFGSGKVWIARDDEYAQGSRAGRRHPDRSAKSTDRGKTWDGERLGSGGIDGEYYVRVFLDDRRPRGSLTLPVIDLGNLGDAALGAPVTSIGPVRIAVQADAGRAGRIALRVRSGSTYVPGDGSWSKWRALGEAGGVLEDVAGRFVQAALILTTADPLETPRLSGVTVEACPRGPETPWTDAVRVLENRNETIVRTSIPFAYEPFDHPRLKALRERYDLDAVVRGARGEFDLIVRLARWASARFARDHFGDGYPPWDALEILAPHADGTPVGGFCLQHNLVLLQACESFGIPGRIVSIGPGDLTSIFRGGHEAVELWSNEHRKWVCVDAGTARYAVDRAGRVPLSLLELRRRQLEVLRGAPEATTAIVEIAEGRYAWDGLKGWPPFVELRLIPRSNFLEKRAPLPLQQGRRGWFWTGHFVFTDERHPARLLYGNRIRKDGDFEWTLNQARYVLEASETPGRVRVHLEHGDPRLRDVLGPGGRREEGAGTARLHLEPPCGREPPGGRAAEPRRQRGDREPDRPRVSIRGSARRCLTMSLVMMKVKCPAMRNHTMTAKIDRLAWPAAFVLLWCGAAPAGEPDFLFEDIIGRTGLDRHLHGIQAHAAAWGDVDQDGVLDLFVGSFYKDLRGDPVYQAPGEPVPGRVYSNRRGSFVLDPASGVDIRTDCTAAVFADFDDDGDLDLYVSSFRGREAGSNQLFENRGEGRFAEITRRCGACPREFSSRSVGVFDYDVDGRLDLFVAEGDRPVKHSRLYRNMGALRFEDVTERAGLPGDISAVGVAVGDVTRNGYPDLFVSGQGSNRLFLNERGRFREATSLRDVFRWESENPTYRDDTPCGATFGDVDGDGRLDLLVGHHYKMPWRYPERIRLFLNLGAEGGDPVFKDISEAAGLEPLTCKAPHVEIRDFDNDGRPDLYTSIIVRAEGRIRPVIYKNLGVRDGLPRFRQRAFEGVDFPTDEERRMDIHGIVKRSPVMYFAPGPSGDVDGDGRLDLLLPNWWPTLPSFLLRNVTPGGNHWLRVRVIGTKKLNRMGIGATVSVFPAGKGKDAEARIGMQEIATACGYSSSQEAVAHFGLGTISRCDVLVELPGSGGRILREDVPADRTVVIREE